MKRIIIDTNFLLIPAQFNIYIFDEIDKLCDFTYKLYIIDKTIDEINNIIETAKKASDKNAAKLALKLIKAKDINIIYTAKDKSVDDLILETLKEGDIVATQDKPLKTRIKNKKIVLRQKKYLKVMN